MAVNINPVNNIPDTQSTGDQWMLWHKALRKNYGVATANFLFLEAWKARGCSGITCSASTQELREYLSDQGITISSGIFEYYVDKMDEMEDFFTSALNVGLYAGIAIVVFILLIVGYIIYKILNNDKLTGAAISVASRGVL